MSDVIQGVGNSGSFVHAHQTMAAKQGFKNVSKLWYDQTMSYEQGLEELEKDRKEREDITCEASAFVPANVDGKAVFIHNPTGRHYTATEHALRQFATWAYIPHTYVNSAMAPVLKPGSDKVRFQRDDMDLSTFVYVLSNGHRHIQQDKKFLFRTYKDGTLRAMLSEDYSIVDNRWYIEQLQKILPGGRLSHWRGDADTIYGNVLIMDSIRKESDSDYGGMLAIGNSEIGLRQIFQLPSVFRAICMNGCIWDQTKGKRFKHIHRGINLDNLALSLMENVNAQIPLLDSVVDAFLQTREMKLTAKVKQAFALIAEENVLTAAQISKIAEQFVNHEKADKNLFGLINAVTRAGQVYDAETWFGFDKLAGKLAGMNSIAWRNFNTRASTLADEQVNKTFAMAV